MKNMEMWKYANMKIWKYGNMRMLPMWKCWSEIAALYRNPYF